MATTDTPVSELIINKLTQAQYDAILQPSDTELYLVPDEVDSAPTSGSDNYVTSGGVYTALQDKTDKVSNPTNGNFAALDSSGNLTDSGHKHSDYLTSHQDISGKADKVSNATNGNFAALDSNGNLTDSGHKHSDYITSQVNADWNASSGAAQILNKPIIPDAVSGTDDGTNWTSLTIGNTTKAIPAGGSTTLSGLSDINISSPFDGQILKYENSSSKWINSSAPTEIPSQTGNSGKFLTTNGSAVSWANVPTELPAITGNASKILAVNSGATGVEWITNSGGGGLTNYDFIHTASQAVSGSVTVTYAANTRGSRMVSASADLSITFAVNNSSDNYLWIKNTGSSDIDILISSVTYNNSSVSNVYMPNDGISVPAGKVCEIGIVCNADGAFITARSDLSL